MSSQSRIPLGRHEAPPVTGDHATIARAASERVRAHQPRYRGRHEETSR